MLSSYNNRQTLSCLRTLRAFVVLFIVLSGTVSAEKPGVTALFPAGGQIGQTLDVDINGKLGTAPVHVWTDNENLTAEPTKDGKRLRIAVSAEAKPGVSWLRVWNAEGAAKLLPFVVGRLPELQETEPNQTIEEAGKTDAVNHVVNGRLHKSGELDTFKVTLKKDATLVADLLANNILKSPMDGVLQIFSADGFLLAHADDSPKLDPRLIFTAPEDGDYYIRVFAFPETPTSSIRYAGGADYIYRLTLTTGPFVHHLIPLTVPKDKPTPIIARGWNLPEGGVLQDFVPTPENVKAELPFPSTIPLALRDVGHAVFAEASLGGLPEGIPLSPPFSLTGHIRQADEVDAHRVTGKKGETLMVKVESDALGFPLDPVLEIKDEAGQSIKVVDDKSRGIADVEYSWKVPADGTYQVCVTDRYGHGGPEYAYLLTVAPPEKSFSLSLAADVFTLTGDKPLEIPVTINRQNGFSEKIEITTAGLPDGIKVENVVSEPKGASAKSVKLKLTVKEKNPFHGPIKIVGKAGAVEKPAITPNEFASPNAQHAWISYQPKK